MAKSIYGPLAIDDQGTFSHLPSVLAVSASSALQGVEAASVTVDDDIAKVSVVGVGMRGHSGVAARMFEALAVEDINIDMIATSEIKISVAIRRAQAGGAMEVLHDAFKLELSVA
mgnify:CR=1 FL=1